MIVNKVGLRKRESYDEIVNYIQTDTTKIKYLDRKATFLMRTNQCLSLLDTDGLEEQEQNIEKQQKVAEVLARKIASSSGGTEALVRPNQLALLDTERNASAYAAGQQTTGQQRPVNKHDQQNNNNQQIDYLDYGEEPEVLHHPQEVV